MDAGCTQVEAALKNVLPGDQKPIDPGIDTGVFRHAMRSKIGCSAYSCLLLTIKLHQPGSFTQFCAEQVLRLRREQRNRSIKFLHQNKKYLGTSSSSGSHRSGRYTPDSLSDSELLAMSKGLVQEEERPRLLEWLKSANEDQRRNYLAVFGQLRESVEAGRKSLWVRLYVHCCDNCPVDKEIIYHCHVG